MGAKAIGVSEGHGREANIVCKKEEGEGSNTERGLSRQSEANESLHMRTKMKRGVRQACKWRKKLNTHKHTHTHMYIYYFRNRK